VARVVTCSAMEGTGLEEIWKIVSDRTTERKRCGYPHTRRSEQNANWRWSLVDQQLHDMLHQRPNVSAVAECVAAQVRAGTLSPVMASERIISALLSGTVSPVPTTAPTARQIKVCASVERRGTVARPSFRA
jgi:putative protein kinase ArgK-like GTPase of G3E family